MVHVLAHQFHRNFLTNFLSESGYLHKAVLLQSGAHIIEEVQVFEQPQPVKSLKLSIPKVHVSLQHFGLDMLLVLKGENEGKQILLGARMSQC